MTVDTLPRSVASATRWAQGMLARAGIDGARAEARLLLRHAAGLALERQISAPDAPLDQNQASRLADAVARRARREPMAHIVGRREFWSLDFIVTPDTLDPRPDSETVIDAALARLDSRAAPYQILDLGTGTGCLLLALLSELPAATGIGVDIEPGAARVARRNAERLGLTARSAFFVGDWAAAIDRRFDLVVCNPPYVPTDVIDTLEPEVARFEPRRALDGGADGFAAYGTLIPALSGLIGPGGTVVIEVGAGQADAAAEALARHGFGARERHADLAGIERCISAKWDKNPIRM